jgi:flavodoxin
MSAGLDLSDKPVAVFGLGDSVSYGEYFCDAMEEVYRCVPCSDSEATLHLLCGRVSCHV